MEWYYLVIFVSINVELILSNTIRKKTVSLDLGNYIKSLYLLMKPRVMSLVIFTCAVGFLTSNSNTNITDAMIGITLVALGAGAAGCLNMWYESDLRCIDDKNMFKTNSNRKN